MPLSRCVTSTTLRLRPPIYSNYSFCMVSTGETCFTDVWGKNEWNEYINMPFTFFFHIVSHLLFHIHSLTTPCCIFLKSLSLSLCQNDDFCSYCTFICLLIVVCFLLLCHLEGWMSLSNMLQSSHQHLTCTDITFVVVPPCWSPPACYKQPKSNLLR